MSEKEVLSVLLTDPKETLKRLVAKSERIFKINKETGAIVVLPPRIKLTDRQLLGILLLGRYFATKLELMNNDSIGIEELKKITQMEDSSLSARLSDLKRDGFVEATERGSYRVAYANLASFGELLDEIERGAPAGLKPELPVTISITEELASTDLASHTDPDAIVLTLRGNGAYPGALPERWLTADEIIDWAKKHGGLIRAETLKKYTLPQDLTLKPFLAKKKEGKNRLYQLSRKGLERSHQLMQVEGASGKS